MDKKRFGIALVLLLMLMGGGYFLYQRFIAGKQEAKKVEPKSVTDGGAPVVEAKKASPTEVKKDEKKPVVTKRRRPVTRRPTVTAQAKPPAKPAPRPVEAVAPPQQLVAEQRPVEAAKPTTAELLAKAAAERRRARCEAAGKDRALCEAVVEIIEGCHMPSIFACATKDEVLLSMKGNPYGVALLPHLPWRERLNIAFRPYHRSEETLDAVINDFAFRDVHNVVDRPLRISSRARDLIEAALIYFPEIFPDREARQRLIYPKPLMAAVDVTSPHGGYWLSNASTRTGCDDNSLFGTGGCVQNISTSSGAAKRVRVYRLERVSDWDRIWFQRCLDDFGNPELQYCRTLGLAKSTH